MNTKYQIIWEEFLDDKCRRMKVFGGWIFEDFSQSGDGGDRISICFIPDPEHKWELV